MSIERESEVGDETRRQRGRESLLDMIDRLHREFPDDGFDDLPADFAMNYKHYLHGWPKEQRD